MLYKSHKINFGNRICPDFGSPLFMSYLQYIYIYSRFQSSIILSSKVTVALALSIPSLPVAVTDLYIKYLS